MILLRVIIMGFFLGYFQIKLKDSTTVVHNKSQSSDLIESAIIYTMA